MVFSSVASRGISVSAPTAIGYMTIRNITVMGAVVNNNSVITCVAVGPIGTNGTMTSSAYLSIQGQSTRIWYVLIQYVD